MNQLNNQLKGKKGYWCTPDCDNCENETVCNKVDNGLCCDWRARREAGDILITQIGKEFTQHFWVSGKWEFHESYHVDDANWDEFSQSISSYD